MADDAETTPGLVGVLKGELSPEVFVLGPLAVEVRGRAVHVAGFQRRRLLAMLASRAGRMASVEAIVDALWGESPPPSAAKTVQSHIVRLRRSLAGLGEAVIETVPGGYRLALDPDSIDAGRAVRLAADGHQCLRAGAPAAAAERFAAALELWRGPAYVEFRDADFAASDGVRLDELHLATREDLAEAQVAAGAVVSAIAGLEPLVSDEPGRERAWGLLMHALYVAGRQHDALGAFQRARQVLASSFGLEPGPELRSMERQILDQDPSLAPTTGRATLAGALRSSTPFVGRVSERTELDMAWRMARQGTGQLRIVCGPLGSGRTRLIADLSGRVLDDGGDVEYVRAADGFDGRFAASGSDRQITAGAIVDAVGERCRRAPMTLIVDDVEWSAAPVVSTITALADAIEDFSLLLILIVDTSGGGPAVATVRRLDPEGARTLELGSMPDADIAAIVGADGVEAGAVPAVVAVAAGLPGTARREAAAWAERTASSRLRTAASSSAGALAVAEQAQVSVLDEVVELVAARARRDEMRSAKWTGRQPYRSLASYEPQDAEVFVGRERLVAELATRVLERRLVVVVGASGSGKSSLVRAGLIPLARSGRLPGDAPWPAHVIVPSRDPLAALHAVEELDEAGPQLLVVDQFEEAFSAPPAIVDTFASRLLDLAGDPALDVHVVIVVRADEYRQLTGVAGLSAAIEHAQLLVGPPTYDEVRRIVEEPARRTGLTVEPALVDMVTRDVDGHDAALPLVSAAMAEVWEGHAGTELRADGYRQIGGIATAVERLGEQALQRAGPSGCDPVRELLLRLADVTDDGLWTRRRVPIDEVPEELAAAVDALVTARLVVRGETTIEIVHEVVFRAWPRLLAWLDEARTDLLRERELTVAARTWDADGRSDDNVYRGVRLEAGAEWMSRHSDDSSPLVAAFIDAGQRRADRETVEAEARLAREVRARRNVTGALVAASVLLVLALIAGVLAVRHAGRADTAADIANRETDRADSQAAAALREAERADAAALSADAERLGALAGLEDDLDTSMLLAAQAYSMADTASTRGALLRSVQRSPNAVRMVRSDGPRFLWLALSPDGTTLAVNENSGGTTLYDARNLRHIGHFAAANLGGLAWTPDGTAFAILDEGAGHNPENPDEYAFDAVLVDAATLTERARYSGRTAPAGDLAFSHDGRTLVASPQWTDGSPIPEITVWDVARPGPPTRIVELPDGTQVPDGQVSFDASGDHVAVSVADATVLINVRTGERRTSFPGSAGLFSPDGRTLAVNSGPGTSPVTLDLLDVQTGARRSLQGAHTEPILRREFSRDGTMLVTTGDDRVARVWDTSTGVELHTLSGHTGRVLAGAFSPDGNTLYTTGLDRSIITWDLAGRDTLERVIIPPAEENVFSEHFTVTSDGASTAALTLDGGLLAASDLRTGTPRAPIDTGHGVAFRLVAGDASTVYTGGEDGAVRRWDVATGDLLAERLPSASETGIYALAMPPDRSILYAQTWIGDVLALDPATFETIDADTLGIHPYILSAAVSPDGDSLAMSTSEPATVSMIDVSTGATRTVAVPGDVFTLAFAPGGSLLIAGDVDGRVLRIDTDRAEIIGPPVVRHDGFVDHLSISTDGERFTSGSTDGNVGLWETATGRYVGTVQPGSPNTVVRSSWAADGHTLVVIYEDGSVYDFDTRPQSWVDQACRTAGRQLTESEWTEVLPDQPYAPTCS